MSLFLVTGAAGFIGSALVRALLDAGHMVRGLDNLATGQRRNLAGLPGSVDFREGDLRDFAAVQAACEGVDFVLHQGALPSVPLSVKEPIPSHTSNIDGTFHLLEAARLAGVKRVIYAASSSAYGEQPGFPRHEEMRPQPISPYAVQKLTGELYLGSYWQVYGLETVSLRYFNIFGPRQRADSPYSGVLARFILQMRRGERPVIFGDGEQSRDFTFVENAVIANLQAAAAPAEKVAGRVFNVACGDSQTLNQAFRSLAKLLQFDREPEYQAARVGDVRRSFADISAARAAFGYEPRIGFQEGLRRTVEWYQADAETAG